MTYFGFLLRFLFIPILIYLAITYWDNKKNRPAPGFQNGRAVWVAIGIHILLAVVYTTPWDNFLVATGVWYYNPALVTGLGLLPLALGSGDAGREIEGPMAVVILGGLTSSTLLNLLVLPVLALRFGRFGGEIDDAPSPSAT